MQGAKQSIDSPSIIVGKHFNSSSGVGGTGYLCATDPTPTLEHELYAALVWKHYQHEFAEAQLPVLV